MVMRDADVWHQVHAQREDGVAAMFLIREIEPRADQPKIFVVELPYPVTDLSGQPDAAGYRRLPAFQEQLLEPAGLAARRGGAGRPRRPETGPRGRGLQKPSRKGAPREGLPPGGEGAGPPRGESPQGARRGHQPPPPGSQSPPGPPPGRSSPPPRRP